MLPDFLNAFPDDISSSWAPDLALPNEMSPVAATLDTPVEISIWPLGEFWEIDFMLISPVEKVD
jgi:hypothetical protein